MKHLVIIFSLLAGSLASQAQFHSTDSLRPKAGEKQFAFGLNNNSTFFALKLYRNPKLAYRFGLTGSYSVTNQNSSSSSITDSHTGTQDSIYYNTNKSNTSSLALNVFIGFQRSFGNYKNFEPYAGVDVRIGNTLSNTTTDLTNNLNYTPLATQPPRVIETKTVQKESFFPSAGLLPFIGFNYYLAERFALGAEYRISLLTYGLSEGQKTSTTYQLSDGSSVTSQNPTSPRTSTLSGSFTGTAYVTATIFLGSRSR